MMRMPGFAVAFVVLAAAATPETMPPGRTGLILDRPTHPPIAGGSVNYVQGAAPVLFYNEIILVAAAGHCCLGREPLVWEGLFARWRRHWYPLLGTRDWGVNDLLDEHEMTYPTMVYWPHPAGLWAIFYASTAWSTAGQPKRIMVGHAVTRLWPFEAWPYRDGRWLQGAGNSAGGVYPIAALADDDGAVRLWVEDTSAHVIACWRLVWNAEHVNNPVRTELVEVARFVGQGHTVPRLTDIARGPDGSLYALESTGGVRDWESGYIAEWRSAAEWNAPAGRIWRRTGRTWQEPGYVLFDAGYLRTPSGDLVVPSIIVANRSDGGYADTGSWALWWWAADGADVPPDWLARPTKRVMGR